MKHFTGFLIAAALLAGTAMPAYSQEQDKSKEQIKAEKQALKEQKKKEKEERRAYFKQAMQAVKQNEIDNTTVVTAAEDPVLAPGAMDPTGKEAAGSIVGTWSGKGLYYASKIVFMKVTDSKYTITFRSNGTFTASLYIDGVLTQNNINIKTRTAYTETYGGTYTRSGENIEVYIAPSQRPQRKYHKYETTGDEFTIKAMVAAGNTDEVMRKNTESQFNQASKNSPVKDPYYKIKRHAGNVMVISEFDARPVLLTRVK